MAIPIPGLPTDNLYKFLALAGIALIALSFFLAHDREENITNSNAEFSYLDLQDSIAEKRLDNEVDRLVKSDDQLNAGAEERAKRAEASLLQKKILPISLRDSIQEDRKVRSTIVQRAKTLRSVSDSLNLVFEKTLRDIKLKYHTDADHYDNFEEQFTYWLGVATAFLGFSGWYKKVQRYQDAMLRKQAEDVIAVSKKEVKKLTDA